MPQHLERAIEWLGEQPVENFWWHDPREDSPEGRLVFPYLRRTAAAWSRLGIACDPDVRKRVAGLASSRSDLRVVLGALINHYPCREFRRVFRRHALAGGVGDMAAWLAAFPDIEPEILEDTLARARKFRQPGVAIEACLVWGRYLGGGDEAWRQIANVLVYETRRDQRRAHSSGFVRHDLETHGTITREETAKINEHLVATELPPLQAGGNHMWWQAREPGHWYQESSLFWLLAHAVLNSRAYARERWCAADELVYAQALAGFSRGAWYYAWAYERGHSRSYEFTDPDGFILRLIARATELRGPEE